MRESPELALKNVGIHPCCFWRASWKPGSSPASAVRVRLTRACACATLSKVSSDHPANRRRFPLNECQSECAFYLCACDPTHLGSDALHDQADAVDAYVSLIALRRTVGRWVLRVVRGGQRGVHVGEGGWQGAPRGRCKCRCRGCGRASTASRRPEPAAAARGPAPCSGSQSTAPRPPSR